MVKWGQNFTEDTLTEGWTESSSAGGNYSAII